MNSQPSDLESDALPIMLRPLSDTFAIFLNFKTSGRTEKKRKMDFDVVAFRNSPLAFQKSVVRNIFSSTLSHHEKHQFAEKVVLFLKEEIIEEHFYYFSCSCGDSFFDLKKIQTLPKLLSQFSALIAKSRSTTFTETIPLTSRKLEARKLHPELQPFVWEDDTKDWDLGSQTETPQKRVKVHSDEGSQPHMSQSTPSSSKKQQIDDTFFTKLQDFLTKLEKLVKVVAGQASHPQIKEFSKEFSFLITDSLENFVTHCQLSKMDDESLSVFFTAFFSLELSASKSLLLVKKIVFPKVHNLQAPCSRILFNMLVNCCKIHPLSIINGLLIPLITAPHFGNHQAEVVNRLLKDQLSADMLKTFLYNWLCGGKDFAESEEAVWNEIVLNILQNFLSNLSSKISFDADLATSIIQHLKKYSVNFAQSTKFTNLIFHLINKHPTVVKPHTATLQSILQACDDNFMKNAALSKLEQMK